MPLKETLLAPIRDERMLWLGFAAQSVVRKARFKENFRAFGLVDSIVTAGMPQGTKQQHLYFNAKLHGIDIQVYRLQEGYEPQETDHGLRVQVLARDGETVGLPIQEQERRPGFSVHDIYPPVPGTETHPHWVVTGTDRAID
jgi:hypothetical protein